MRFCPSAADRPTSVAALAARVLPRALLVVLILGWLMPEEAMARPLRVSRVHFPATMEQHLDPPNFAPPPAPWLVTTALPEAEPAPAAFNEVQLAWWFDACADEPLAARVVDFRDTELEQRLSSLSAPLGEIGAAAEDGFIDDGSLSYLLYSSLFLFSVSSLLSHLTRPRPAYSESDEPKAAGGRPRLPVLLLPPAPAEG
jgi:hypothetical protein